MNVEPLCAGRHGPPATARPAREESALRFPYSTGQAVRSAGGGGPTTYR
jgi:hypothetical protein